MADAPFSDEPGRSKDRPIVVLAPSGKMVRVLHITSQDKNSDARYYCLRQWEYAGLSVKSFVQVNETHRVTDSCFRAQKGKLHPLDKFKVQECMRQYKACAQFADDPA